MLSRAKIYWFSWLLLGMLLVVAACGDATATTAPTPIPAATPTTVPTATATKAPVPTTAVATTATAAATTAAVAANVSSTDALDPKKVEAGSRVFVVQCQLCHLNGGKSSGGAGPNLAFSRKATNPEQVRQFVRKGEAGMAPFDQSKVSDADLENIILYLKTIHQD